MVQSIFQPVIRNALTGNHHGKRVKSEHCGRLSALKDFITDTLFSFPDPQCFWFRLAMSQLPKISHYGRPDVVFATGSPWTALLAGNALAKKFGVPFVAEFRDPWTGNPYKRSLSASLSSRAKRLEKLVCTDATRVVTTTWELRSRFVADYDGYRLSRHVRRIPLSSTTAS